MSSNDVHTPDMNYREDLSDLSMDDIIASRNAFLIETGKAEVMASVKELFVEIPLHEDGKAKTMDVNPYKSGNDEIYENEFENDLIDLFSPASLDIQEDEWNLLVRTDHDLAAQIGYFLLKRNKSLEMLISTTETCAEEHQIRANHYEKQIQYLRDSMEAQTKMYESFEKQIEDLTKNYNQMSDECRQYKERNKSLWEIVDNLEQKCEDYILELDFLKSAHAYDKAELSQKDSFSNNDIYSIPEDSSYINEKNTCNRTKMTRHSSIDFTDQLQSDIVSLKAYAEETSRKHDIERAQRLNCEYKLERLYTENKDLKNHILLLEHRLKSQSNENLLSDIETDAKLNRSKSMTSLDSCNENDRKDSRSEENNNIQYEVNETCHEDEADKNVSIRELFHRFNTVGDTYIENSLNKQNSLLKVDIHKKGDVLSSPRYLSPRHVNSVKTNVRSTNDVCSTCKSKLVKRDSIPTIRRDSNFNTPKPDNKTNENTVANYRDMFAQIFEKLKISRGEVQEEEIIDS